MRFRHTAKLNVLSKSGLAGHFKFRPGMHGGKVKLTREGMPECIGKGPCPLTCNFGLCKFIVPPSQCESECAKPKRFAWAFKAFQMRPNMHCGKIEFTRAAKCIGKGPWPLMCNCGFFKPAADVGNCGFAVFANLHQTRCES